MITLYLDNEIGMKKKEGAIDVEHMEWLRCELYRQRQPNGDPVNHKVSQKNLQNIADVIGIPNGRLRKSDIERATRASFTVHDQHP